MQSFKPFATRIKSMEVNFKKGVHNLDLFCTSTSKKDLTHIIMIIYDKYMYTFTCTLKPDKTALGYPSRYHSNQPAQLQRLDKILKVRMHPVSSLASVL